jgi:hypothetical protein
VGIFTAGDQVAGRVRAVFYGLCFGYRRESDVDARVEARISTGDPIGHSVDLASGGQAFSPFLERAEWLKQFSEPTREFFRERVTHPERYGLEVCSRCRSRPMAVFGFLNLGIREADGLYSMFPYCLCCEVSFGRWAQADGGAGPIAHGRARDSIKTDGQIRQARRFAGLVPRLAKILVIAIMGGAALGAAPQSPPGIHHCFLPEWFSPLWLREVSSAEAKYSLSDFVYTNERKKRWL